MLHYVMRQPPYFMNVAVQNTMGTNQIQQLMLIQRYKEMQRNGVDLPALNDTEFKVYSENGEDGILLYLFSLIGAESKRAVEVCIGNGYENCTANLVINHGWDGIMVEGSQERVEAARHFFKSLNRTGRFPPRIAHEWVTAENINEIIKRQGFSGSVDLFSLDMDGVDYWVWKNLEVIDPRVVVCEYNNLWPADKAMTTRYDAQFKANYNSKFGASNSGASLAAFVKLAKSKGMRLIGCQQYGYNAFFMKNGVGEEYFPEVSVDSCYHHPFTKYAVEVRSKELIPEMWEEV